MFDIRGLLIKIVPQILSLVCSALIVTLVWAQQSQDQRTVQATFEETDIRQIIAAVAGMRGEEFVIHPDVNAQVTLDVSTPVSESEFYDIFLSILQSHGYQTVVLEKVTHIVPVGEEPGEESAPPAERQTVGSLDGAIRPVPYFVDGQITGYRIYPGSNRTKFDSLGFRPGDLVTGFDGFPIEDASGLVRFLESANASEVNFVTIKRGEESMDIQLD